MQVTYQTKIKDVSCYPLLEQYAHLYGRVEHALFRDLYVCHLPLNDLKQQYLPQFGITARQFNSVRVFLEGKVKAVREGLALRLSNLREKVASCQKAVKQLATKLTQLQANLVKAKAKATQSQSKQNRSTFTATTATATATTTVKPSESGSITKLKFSLHQKKRRLHLLQTKLQHLEQEAERPVPRLTFGSNRLFRAQFNLEANGFSSHDAWKAEWQAARSNQFVCIGSKDETGGNQSCTYFPTTHTLRLRLPHALTCSNSGDKYLNIADVSFRYGEAVIKAALTASGGQALTCRFIRRAAKTRSGKKKTGPTGSNYTWYVQVTTEREATPKITERHLGAIGLDLNPALLAIATIDRYGNPISSEHFPVQLHKRSSEQIKATATRS
jgi:hypothetical protein